jgi:peptide/nickel transport system ATP-binding protein
MNDGAPPLLELRGLVRDYPLPRPWPWRPAPRLRALDGVDLRLDAGVNLGIVGESGSGKSTLARLALALERPSAGQVLFEGRDLNLLEAAELRAARRAFQIVFQDPYGSLDPRMKVERLVGEPLAVLGAGGAGGAGAGLGRAERRARAQAMLEAVGLRAADLDKYPHEFSGGQRQRIAIARALITQPRLIVADEPVSALDVSVQAQVLNLMLDLQRDFGISYLLISHDLAVVAQLCDEVAVLYQGRVVEQGSAAQLFAAPAHPYTQALRDAVPRLDGWRLRAARPPASVPEPAAAPAPVVPMPAAAAPWADGCAYRGRCARAAAVCARQIPLLQPLPQPALGATAGRQPAHRAACHRPLLPAA